MVASLIAFPKARFKKTQEGYEVWLDLSIRTYQDEKTEAILIGTTAKFDPNDSSRRDWLPTTHQGKELWRYTTRKDAAFVLMQAYQQNPRTVGMPEDRPDALMIARCRKIARLLGPTAATHYPRVCINQKILLPQTKLDEAVYEDKFIKIVAGAYHGGLEITRKPMPQLGMPTDNPCIMVDPWGVCFRTHGESHHLEKHVARLAQEIN
jgi:hypothetical protein